MEILRCDFKQGLEQLLQQTQVKAIILGTRRWVVLLLVGWVPWVTMHWRQPAVPSMATHLTLLLPPAWPRAGETPTYCGCN